MSKVNPKLFAAIAATLKVSDRQVQRLIERRVREDLLSRGQAALLIASENGVNLSKYASSEEIADLRVARSNKNVDRLSTTLPPLTLNSSATTTVRSKNRANERRRTSPTSGIPRRGTSVFVVHGRDDGIRASLFRFLRSVGLVPLEWNSLLAKTKKSSPYIGEILDVAFQEAVAIVVLMTPDDEAKLSDRYLTKSDPSYERDLTPQARPNVLFEAGMAFGKNPSSTVLVQVGHLRPFSDVGGRHVVRLNNSVAKRQELLTKLANAGCNVDTSGSDWVSEGDFDLKMNSE